MANQKKKVVVTANKEKKTVKATVSKSQRIDHSATPKTLVFGKSNYMTMLLGIGLIFLGMVLMTGGSMPSPDVWDDNIIYSTRRTLIAPLLILIGLGVEFYAIFRK